MSSTIGRIKRIAHSSFKDSARYGLLRAAMRKFPERKLFCPVPFERMDIKRGGTAHLCGWLKRSAGNLHDGSLTGLWNSPMAQEIRASILDGTFRYCNFATCPYIGSGELPLQKDVAGDPYQEIISHRRTKMETMKLWLSFDHRCNLRCTSCRTASVQISGKEEAENQSLMESVQRGLASVTTLGICAKGEPFVSPVIRDFLFHFDGSGHRNLRLFILTNGQLLNRECWERMAKAHPAIAAIQVSMDAATKRTYERTRLGGSFETLMENLRYLSTLRSQNAIGTLIISFVVSARNFTEMKEFVQMGFDLGCDHVYFAFMSNWGVFTNEEYRAMAVHHPDHEKHRALKEMLADPFFSDPRVFVRASTGFRRNDILRQPFFV